MNEKTKLRRPRKLKAFTLLELIVVLAITSILASIIIPSTIDSIRSSKIESANTKAEQIYRAVQDYCTDMQISRTPLKKSSTDTSSLIPAFPVTTDSSNFGITFSLNADGTWNMDVKGATMYNNTDSVNKCIKGIKNYIGSATVEDMVDSAFYVLIDADTYTVSYAYYCEENDARESVNNMTTPYTQVFGSPKDKNSKSQEYDTNQRLSGKATSKDVVAYVGQYPIYQ